MLGDEQQYSIGKGVQVAGDRDEVQGVSISRVFRRRELDQNVIARAEQVVLAFIRMKSKAGLGAETTVEGSRVDPHDPFNCLRIFVRHLVDHESNRVARPIGPEADGRSWANALARLDGIQDRQALSPGNA
jgi:hypothetical protein